MQIFQKIQSFFTLNEHRHVQNTIAIIFLSNINNGVRSNLPVCNK